MEGPFLDIHRFAIWASTKRDRARLHEPLGRGSSTPSSGRHGSMNAPLRGMRGRRGNGAPAGGHCRVGSAARLARPCATREVEGHTVPCAPSEHLFMGPPPLAIRAAGRAPRSFVECEPRRPVPLAGRSRSAKIARPSPRAPRPCSAHRRDIWPSARVRSPSCAAPRRGLLLEGTAPHAHGADWRRPGGPGPTGTPASSSFLRPPRTVV